MKKNNKKSSSRKKTFVEKKNAPKKRLKKEQRTRVSKPHFNKKRQQKKRKKQPFTKKMKQVSKEIVITLVFFSIILFIIQRLAFTIVKMEGYSMLPTINDEELFFVNKLASPKRFSLVYYRDPETKETSIRRVIGLPKEQIVYRTDQLLVNGEFQVERFLEKAQSLATENGGTVTDDFSLKEIIDQEFLPEEEYLLLGDNRSYATDSREFGTVKRKDIIGVVDYRVFPIHMWTHF